MSLNFQYDIQMVGSEFGINSVKAWIHPALYQLQSAVTAGGVMVQGIFLTQSGPISTNGALFKHHSLHEYYC